MSDRASTVLSLSRTALRILQVVNLVAIAGITVVLLLSFVMPGFLARALEAKGIAENPGVALGVRGLAVLGIVAATLMHIVLSRLEAIVDTVEAADPFVVANARRLDAIAWAVLGLEALHACAAALGVHLRAAGVPLDLDWDFSGTRILTGLMLFVLARVFEQGARMRADLARTV